LSAGCRRQNIRRQLFFFRQCPHNDGGVYRCGFAGSQEAYEAAYDRLFTALDWVSDRLEKQRYLVGDTITEADVRLFTTSSAIGASSPRCRCCGRMRETCSRRPGFGDTVDFVQIKQHYYIVHADINPTRIVPKGPELANWLTPHSREALGGSPFSDGTPPGPTLDGERVPADHGPVRAR
jgi:glutathionyl-hydroquinone reductase